MNDCGARHVLGAFGQVAIGPAVSGPVHVEAVHDVPCGRGRTVVEVADQAPLGRAAAPDRRRALNVAHAPGIPYVPLHYFDQVGPDRSMIRENGSNREGSRTELTPTSSAEYRFYSARIVADQRLCRAGRYFCADLHLP
ncbi:hypothetical protein ACTD5D_09475 [Nocardia takedensis]|uniref:hypothetical protein n=1 Tax=Nocardia takedensis TaxID=259390 RepID=UPI003F757600